MSSSDVIATLAVLISVSVFAVQVHDRRRAWNREDRAQAEQVAGWITVDRSGKVIAHLRNGSAQPVYNVLWMLRERTDLDVPTLPPFVGLLPPETTLTLDTGLEVDNESPGLRVYLTFRDGRGAVWQRDTHGRLTPTLRPVDVAPPADPITGRIPQPGDRPTPGRKALFGRFKRCLEAFRRTPE